MAYTPSFYTTRTRHIRLTGTATLTGVAAYCTNRPWTGTDLVEGGGYPPQLVGSGSVTCGPYTITLYLAAVTAGVYDTSTTPPTRTGWTNTLTIYAKLSGPGVPDDGTDPATATSMWAVASVSNGGTYLGAGHNQFPPGAATWSSLPGTAVCDVTVDVDTGEGLTADGLAQVIPPGGTLATSAAAHGGPTFSQTQAQVSTWAAMTPYGLQPRYLYPGGGASLTANNGALFPTAYTTPDGLRYYPVYASFAFAAGVSASWPIGYDTGSGYSVGMTGPSALAASTAWASADASTLRLAAPPVGKANQATASLGGTSPQDVRLICRLMAPGGAESRETVDLDVVFGWPSQYAGTPRVPILPHFHYAGVTGTLDKTYRTGGYDLVLANQQPDGTHARATDSDRMLLSDGVTRLPYDCTIPEGLPKVFLSADNYAGSNGSIAHLPFGQQGGLTLSEASPYPLAAAPWTVGGASGWQGANGVGVSTSGAGGAYLRLSVTGTPPAGQYAVASVNLPGGARLVRHRFVRVRVRSIGSANLPLSIGFLSSAFASPGFARPEYPAQRTGADGEWVERVFDVQRGAMVHTPYSSDPVPPQPPAAFYSGFYLSRTVTALTLTGLAPGVYEVEWVKGERQTEARASYLPRYATAGASAPVGPAVLCSSASASVEPLHALTDGQITLSLTPWPGGGYSPAGCYSVAAVASQIAAQPWPAWSAASVVARRSGKPANAAWYPVTDWYDADCPAVYLGGGVGGMWDGTGAVRDRLAPATLPLQWWGTLCRLYPGCGDPFAADGAAGAFGTTTRYVTTLAVRGEVAGILTGGAGGQIVATSEQSGTEDGRASVVGGGDTGLARMSAPGVVAGHDTPLPKVSLSASALPSGVRAADTQAWSGTDPGTKWANIEPGRFGRVYVAFVTPRQGQAEGPCCLNTGQGGYFAAAHVDRRDGGIRFRRTDGPQVPVAGRAWAVDAIVPGTTALDRRPQMVYDASARGTAPGGTLRLLFTRYASDPSAGASGATGGDVYETTSSDDGATWGTPVKLNA